MNRAVKQDKKRDEKHMGGSVNRLKKAEKWTNFLGHAYQGVAHAIKPMAKPIIATTATQV